MSEVPLYIDSPGYGFRVYGLGLDWIIVGDGAIQNILLDRNLQRFRGGLVFDRLFLYHSSKA